MFHRIIVTAAVAFVGVISVAQTVQAEPKYLNTGPALISNVTVIDGFGNASVAAQDIAI